MSARMPNPAAIVPGAMQAIQSLISATHEGGVPSTTLNLVHLRASQINGCQVCVDTGTCYAQQAGESDDRLFSVASWRNASCFTEEERAALALAEAVTRLSVQSFEREYPPDCWFMVEPRECRLLQPDVLKEATRSSIACNRVRLGASPPAIS